MSADIPAALEALRSDDPEVWMPACAELHETLWHQGTVMSAAADAVPLLISLLARPGETNSGADCAASLLCCIATGEGALHHGLRVDGEARLRARLADRGQSLEAALEAERAALESTRRDVSAGLRRLLPYLTHPAPDLRGHVAATLGDFPENAAWLLPAIDAALAAEIDPEVRKALADSRTRLASPTRSE